MDRHHDGKPITLEDLSPRGAKVGHLDDQPTAGFEDAIGLFERGLRSIDVLEGFVEGDDIERVVVETGVEQIAGADVGDALHK